MHRVELKELREVARITHGVSVPNAPCGVERDLSPLGFQTPPPVPNAPCGVES